MLNTEQLDYITRSLNKWVTEKQSQLPMPWREVVPGSTMCLYQKSAENNNILFVLAGSSLGGEWMVRSMFSKKVLSRLLNPAEAVLIDLKGQILKQSL